MYFSTKHVWNIDSNMIWKTAETYQSYQILIVDLCPSYDFNLIEKEAYTEIKHIFAVSMAGFATI